ncbi:MAG: CPBP family intramembrane metalloprotease [Firmicutes bacterium]|nr:CPBP family intramembrane metalloprotease [Bacillota bacterium]
MIRIDLLKEDKSYMKQVNQFSKIDGLLAVFLFLFYIAIVAYDNSNVDWVSTESHVIISGLLRVIVVALPILIVLYLRKQSLSSIGISNRNFMKSTYFALSLSLLYFIGTLLYSLIVKNQIIFKVNHTLFYYVIYYFLIDALNQEILFRGFLSPRIRSVIKNRWLSIATVGLMFSLMHFFSALAFQFWDFGRAIDYVWVQMIYSFGFHVIAQLLYQRYNNLVGPVILHGFGNMLAYMIIFA